MMLANLAGRAQHTIESRQIESSLLHEITLPDVYIKLRDSSVFFSWLERHYPGIEAKHEGNGIILLQSYVRLRLSEVMNMPGVAFIDRADRKAKEEVVLGDFDQTVNGVTSAHAWYPEIKGTGLTVSVKEKPFDLQDLDLQGRILLNNQFDEASTPHATFMATIAAGAGNTSPYARGAAWGSLVTTSDFDRLLPDDGNSLVSQYVTVQNHSYGVGLENYYGIESYAYDQFALDYPKILHVFSSGNLGPATPSAGLYSGVTGYANLTGQFKVSKNTLAVGSSDRFGQVVPLSSRGPAHDGRVKPELIAFGDAGSSEAAAIVSGVTLLVQQTYRDQHNELPDAALVKGILINSAQDTGRPHVDFETGFGNADAVQALRTTMATTYFEGEIGTGEEKVFTISVPDDQHMLKVTLVWHDPPAEILFDKALVNDLDLSVQFMQTNESYEPWILRTDPEESALQEPAYRGKDRLNTIEQVTLDEPAAGEYLLKVKANSIPVGVQRFFVVYDVMPKGFEWRYPLLTDALRSGEANVLRWRWNDLDKNGTLEYRTGDDQPWQVIETAISLGSGYYEWTTPEGSVKIQFRMNTGNTRIETDWVAMTRPQRLKVGYDCPEELLLTWPKDAAAERYVVYALGDQYLEPVLTTTDTFAVFRKNEITNGYFSYAPVIGDHIAYRELTINYETQGTGCYFISVLPREYITDSEVLLDVSLGTVYNLKAAELERWSGFDFVPVAKLQTVTSTRFTMQDPSPVSGTYPYRVKLETQSGLTVYSDEVRITYVSETAVFVYPNPLYSNEIVSIVVDDDGEARLQLLDSNGRVLRETIDSGPEKTIDTSGLPSGAYFLRIHSNNGRVDSRKLIVLK
jgi:hypothetical protein